ncbi:uncharacterized protein LOC121922319 isoform X3 [Sceloporus undulatus]|uniref:uncharacterized protein LOC121922319 isoform X3 n=1 Tax=Sceloporus undulatus TaxID=8520 RepID=UPI001C4AE4FC|nr:uncharacterized protein LOC121922319 isoform X3 [Sceloporus undulatus]
MLCYLALLICSFCSSVWPLLSPDPGLLSQGRTHWQQARELARHPRYGTCWIGALEQLDAGCKELDEEKQSHIALAFAHCHLQRSGRGFPPCKPHSSIRDCTQHMDSVAFGVYTEFFTHAHSICYFLHNEAWQQRAQDTVHRLTSSSESVARQLESTNQLAEEIVRAQDATLRSQEQILQDGELLRQVLHDSSQGIRQAFQALQDSATEQRVAFAEIFNRVAFLQRFVVGESNAIYSLFFNLLSGAASLVLTSCQRTSGARFILLTLVGVNIYLERVIGSFLMDGSEDGYDMTLFILGEHFLLGGLVASWFCWSWLSCSGLFHLDLQGPSQTEPAGAPKPTGDSDRDSAASARNRLLPNKPELLLQESVLLSAEDEAFFMDSGFPEQLSSSECRDERQGQLILRLPGHICKMLAINAVSVEQT